MITNSNAVKRRSVLSFDPPSQSHADTHNASFSRLQSGEISTPKNSEAPLLSLGKIKQKSMQNMRKLIPISRYRLNFEE